MGKKVWEFRLDDGKHTVALEHGHFSGRRSIAVDGRLIISTGGNILDSGSEHHFQVSGVPCVLRITSGFRFKYELYVDRKPVNGENARQIRWMRNGLGVLHIYVRALLYSYILLFCFVLPLGVSVAGILVLLEGEVGWPAFIMVILPLLLISFFLHFTRRRGFWKVFRDVFSRRTKVMGRVSMKRTKVTSAPVYTTTEHFITVEHTSFPVFGKIYDWLWKGDTVVVYYWPHSRTVAWVEKVSGEI